MKLKKKNIIKIIAELAAAKKIFLLIFIVHLLLAHIILQSYSLCLENDGQITLETAVDKKYCCNSVLQPDNFETMETKVDENCNLCKDIFITENCDEDYSNIIKKLQPAIISVLNILKSNVNEETIFASDNKKQNSSFPELDSYKTVLLLI